LRDPPSKKKDLQLRGRNKLTITAGGKRGKRRTWCMRQEESKQFDLRRVIRVEDEKKRVKKRGVRCS